MAIFKKPTNDLFNLIQVSSLELSKQLLTKKYYNSRLYLSEDEYNTDDTSDPTRKLIWRRGDYQVGFNGDWDSVSDPRNLNPADQPSDWVPEIHTAGPNYYKPQIPNPAYTPGGTEPEKIPNPAYDGHKDPTNLDPSLYPGRKRADNSDPEEPYYDGTANPRYAFISLRGVINPTLGVTWEKESVSGAVDGDNINFNLACHWVGRALNQKADVTKYSRSVVDFGGAENTDYDTTNTAYLSQFDDSNLDPKVDDRTESSDPTDQDASKDCKGFRHDGTPVVFPYFNGNAIFCDPISCPEFEETYDPENPAYLAAHDKSAATYNGKNYGQFIVDLYNFDRTVVTKLPVCSEEDLNKTIIGFTANSLSTPISLQLVDNAIFYKEGDEVFIPSTKDGIGAGVEGTDYARSVDTTKFPKSYHLQYADMAIMADHIAVDATMSEVILPDVSFAVDSLVFSCDFTKK